jgi:hypothetical protein
MASGHVNRIYRPNTWLHRPSLRREDFSCQPGAVHTWHETDMPTLLRNVRSQGQSGKHLLTLSFSGFDPSRTLGRSVWGPLFALSHSPPHRKVLGSRRQLGVSFGGSMKRRDFIAGIGAATAWPLLARAQQKSMPVIGYLSVGFPQLQHPFVVAFHEGLKETGFVAGENLAIEHRWAEERYDRLPELAADLVRHKVDVIVATGELPLRAAANPCRLPALRIRFPRWPAIQSGGHQLCPKSPGAKI